MNLLLIVVIAALALCAWAGYRKGLVKAVFSLLAAVVSLVLVSFVSPVIAGYLQEHTPIYSYVKEKSSGIVAEWNAEHEPGTEEGRIAAIDSYEVPDFIKNYFKSGLDAPWAQYSPDALAQDFNGFISGQIADLAVKAASFILSYVVIRLALHALMLLSNAVARLPVLRSLNKLGGLAAGFLAGLVAVWLFFLILTFLCSTQFGADCMRMIQNSALLSWLYNNDPLMHLLV